MGRLAAPVTPRLTDTDAERVRREHEKAIRDLQDQPASSITVLEGVQLTDLVITPVKHGLGRKPRIILPGTPRGASSAGVIQQYDSPEPSKYIQLRALGFGTGLTITIDIVVL